MYQYFVKPVETQAFRTQTNEFFVWESDVYKRLPDLPDKDNLQVEKIGTLTEKGLIVNGTPQQTQFNPYQYVTIFTLNKI